MPDPTTAAVALKAVAKRFGGFVALHPTDLEIEEGSFLTLLGPSGCGKTTTLRMIAGLLTPSEGDIMIRGQRVNDTPIYRRNLGLVFQNYALFPHRSVFDNVAFGLKYHRVPRADIPRRVAAALELVQLPHLASRYPRELSGGQQQRIALARAIVIEPDVLLLDEPLSALDANLREDMRVELKRIQDQLGITTVFVTHDQSEALAMSDRVVVMRQGHIEQVGAPQEVYNRPASEFVASFLGNANILSCRVAEVAGDEARIAVEGLGELAVPLQGRRDIKGGDEARLVIKAEKLLLSEDGGGPQDGRLAFPAQVETVDYQGQAVRYFLAVAGHQLQAINAIDERPIAQGSAVTVSVRARDCVLLPADGT